MLLTASALPIERRLNGFDVFAVSISIGEVDIAPSPV
jgi:hypothetical protein